MKVKVSEIFSSIQGEGINLGAPSVFLRTALCNLACSWCDSRYTWDWDNYDYSKEVKEMNVAEIYDEISMYRTKRLVVTGGEPLIQQRQLEPLLRKLKEEDFFVEVETNGTIVPDIEIDSFVDQWNVSPKTSNSGNPLNARFLESSYSYFSKNPKSYFKYVVSSASDLDEVEKMVSAYCVPANKVILMPQATTREDLDTKSRWLSVLVNERGYRFSTRLQVLLWDNRRGT